MPGSPLGRGLITLASTVLACAVGCGVALADTPAPTTAPTQAPRARTAPLSAPQGRFSWQITPMQTYFTGSNINISHTLPNGKPNPTAASTVYSRLGWQLGYDVAPRTTIYWNRTPNDSIQENVGTTLNNPAIDLIDEIGASYRLERYWNVSAEYYRRWRQCCPGTGDPTNKNPAVANGWSVISSWSVGPNTIIGKPLTVTYQGTEFKHQYTNAAAATATAFKMTGTLNEGTKWTSAETVALRIPVYHQRKAVPFVSFQVLPTYFYSQVEPIYSNALNYGVNVVGSPLVSYTFSIRNLNEHQQGYTFPSPNVQHYSWLIVAANFHGRM